MLADPQSVKVNGSAVSLPRTTSGEGKSVYTSADGLTVLTVTTQKTTKGRLRHTVRLDYTKVVASTLLPSQNEEAGASIYLTIDRPRSGFSAEELKKDVEGLVEFLSASTYEKTTKVIGGES